MKTLILVRHAKSSWDNPDLDDFDRPLNKRGKKNAPFMAEKLKEYGIKPDLIISSPANRALTTAQIFAEILGYPLDKIKQESVIYDNEAVSIIELISYIDDKYNKVAIFGHNPSFTFIANRLSEANIDNIPTCGIVCIEFNTDLWKDCKKTVGNLKFFIYPKKYSEKE